MSHPYRQSEFKVMKISQFRAWFGDVYRRIIFPAKALLIVGGGAALANSVFYCVNRGDRDNLVAQQQRVEAREKEVTSREANANNNVPLPLMVKGKFFVTPPVDFHGLSLSQPGGDPVACFVERPKDATEPSVSCVRYDPPKSN
jgi:hypothetical protein